MFLTKKHLSRRTAIKGLGVTLALPMLEAMVPAVTAQRRTVAGAPRYIQDRRLFALFKGAKALE